MARSSAGWSIVRTCAGVLALVTTLFVGGVPTQAALSDAVAFTDAAQADEL